MDAVMIGFERIPLINIKQKKKAINKLYRNLPEQDEDFNEAIIAGTSDTKKIEYRLTTWLIKLKNIV